MTEKPKIIYFFYILSDQHHGDSLGCIGHPIVPTPNLDKLITENVNFTRCFTKLKPKSTFIIFHRIFQKMSTHRYMI